MLPLGPLSPAGRGASATAPGSSAPRRRGLEPAFLLRERARPACRARSGGGGSRPWRSWRVGLAGDEVAAEESGEAGVGRSIPSVSSAEATNLCPARADGCGQG